MPAVWRYALGAAALSALAAQWWGAPAGLRPAFRHGNSSILPGGAVIAPAGDQYFTGPNPFGLALSASHKALATASAGSGESVVVAMARGAGARWEIAEPGMRSLDRLAEIGPSGWRSVARGLVFSGEHTVFASEGASGRISEIDWSSGRLRSIDLSAGSGTRAYAGDLAFDEAGGLLYAADQANSRIAVIETHSRQAISWATLSGAPFALGLSPDRRTLYAAVDGETGSVAFVDVSDPSAPKVTATVSTGSQNPSGVIAAAGQVFVANADTDSITAIDPEAKRVQAEIPIRIPGMEDLRGVQPAGMAYDDASGLLFVAEAGINAAGVIDPRKREVLGHVPTGWFPTRVAVDRDRVLAAAVKGQGPDAPYGSGEWLQGMLSSFPIPKPDELAKETAFVMEANGFSPLPAAPKPLPAAVRYAVIIAKDARTYDDVLGDIPSASNGPAMGMAALAHFGMHGYADGQRQRLSLKDVAITPNQHAMAAQWTFGDNFYADTPEWQDALEYLARRGLSVEAFGLKPGADTTIRDVDRAAQTIREIQDGYVTPGVDLPRVLFIHLPNDRLAAARPEAGYPYEESYAADNDLALGRILEYLSGTKWWNQMAVFVTENDTRGGVDHLDARRTLLLCAGPWCKRDYVTHVNTGFPGLLKTVFRLMGAPPMTLQDAAATDLSDCFAAKADPAPFHPLPVDKRIFDPGR
ncbi:MAG TPA: YncE family protein [Bryobacteraceae bacterium]|nr:YncE family protein [Bryobacteraceae bacterium]